MKIIKSCAFHNPGMMFERNVGGLDRIARGILGIGLVVVACGAFFSDRRMTGIVATVASTGLLFNAVFGRCGLNKLFGVNTCSRE